MEKQKLLFEIIKTRIPEQYRLVGVLEELLKMSSDSVYRRIRGETELSFSELNVLCEKFHISMDEIFNSKSIQSAVFQYMPVNFSDQESYITYITRLLGTLTAFGQDQDKQIYVTALDIPFYHFLAYPELMFFKLYAWNDTITHTPLTYESFCNRLDWDAIIPVYRQMDESYRHIPSKEIWTNQTIDILLRLLEHYYEIGAFEKRETVLGLISQLTHLMDTVRKYADEGYKSGGGKEIPFSLYLCSVDPENNLMLIKRGENISCTIRLYTVNSIVTENHSLCLEMNKWIHDLILKSVLISGASVRERIRFFRSSVNKITGLVNRIENE